MTSAVIIQARMGSSRLPGKSLADLGGRPVIEWVVERCAVAPLVNEVILATSVNAEDDELVQHVERHGAARVVRGSGEDVLERYALAIETTDASVIVRVTGDCPFVQPAFIDDAIRALEGCDYVATGIDGRFPRGFDVEAVRRAALITAHSDAVDPVEREHVTPFIVRRPKRFSSAPLVCPPWARRPDLRLTLDEQSDLEMLRATVEGLAASPDTPLAEDLTRFLDENPEIVALNASVAHNNVT